MPTLEAVAAGAATALYGERVPVLMHLTAARLHGALPRAIATAVVAVPEQHRPVRVADRPEGTITFVARDVDTLDAVLLRTDLGPALVTTPSRRCSTSPSARSWAACRRGRRRRAHPSSALHPRDPGTVGPDQRMGATLVRLRAAHEMT